MANKLTDEEEIDICLELIDLQSKHGTLHKEEMLDIQKAMHMLLFYVQEFWFERWHSLVQLFSEIKNKHYLDIIFI